MLLIPSFLIVLLACGMLESCQTSSSCWYDQMWCEYSKNVWGLESYKFCLSRACRKCKLCGICDGGDNTLEDVTKERKLQCLAAHNILRSYHKDTSPLEWDEKLAEESQKFADHLVNTVTFAHGAKAENLFLKCGSNGTTTVTCNDASQAWYDEIKLFDYKTYTGFNPTDDVRHFMQVIWKDAKKIGVGIAVHKKTKFVYLVARYDTYIADGVTKDNIMPLI